ncbi:hypothetical protein [Rheinheimera sp.]|uniref:hypothetical protein n=1 Tax=Rheinheimera sp. TaxID=1869214 RepID=UPI0040478ACC
MRNNVYLNHIATSSLIAGMLILSACSDKRSDEQRQDYEQSAYATDDDDSNDDYYSADDTDMQDDIPTPDTSGPTAAQLVAENQIHRTNPFYFPLETIEATDNWQRSEISRKRMNGLTSNATVIKQIKQCYKTTQQSDAIMAGMYYHGAYNAEQKSEEDRKLLQQYYQAFKDKYAAKKGQSVENDLNLYYIEMIPDYPADSNNRFDNLYDAFWQWCVQLPVKHFHDDTSYPLSW